MNINKVDVVYFKKVIVTSHNDLNMRWYLHLQSYYMDIDFLSVFVFSVLYPW